VEPTLYGFLLAAYRTKMNLARSTHNDMTSDANDADNMNNEKINTEDKL